MVLQVYPTKYRATCHGLSAASGKAGAVVGAFGFGESRDTQAGPSYCGQGCTVCCRINGARACLWGSCCRAEPLAALLLSKVFNALPAPPPPAAGELAYKQGAQKTLIGLCVCMFLGLLCTYFVPETKGACSCAELRCAALCCAVLCTYFVPETKGGCGLEPCDAWLVYLHLLVAVQRCAGCASGADACVACPLHSAPTSACQPVQLLCCALQARPWRRSTLSAMAL